MPKENWFYNLLIFSKGLEQHSWLETAEELALLTGKTQKIQTKTSSLRSNSKGKKYNFSWVYGCFLVYINCFGETASTEQTKMQTNYCQG